MTIGFEQQSALYITRINQVLSQQLSQQPAANPSLTQAMHYALLLGGKRLRPLLVYAVGEMLSAPLSQIDSAAAAIECIHAYSLIHDDLPAMDNDDLRRGQPTCHVKYGEAMAILAGDALQSLAFTLLTCADSPIDNQYRLAMVQILAQASGLAGMCAGQAYDLQQQQTPISLAQLEQIHHLKTGALIRAAVQLGRTAAQINDQIISQSLDDYAQAIGLAFQVQDDILDVIGQTAIIGKRAGADQLLGKNTYPALLGLTGAQQKAQQLYQQGMDALVPLVQQYDYDVTFLTALAHFVIHRNK